jgi:cyclic dehypoxanthinyl futalosine synthase
MRPLRFYARAAAGASCFGQELAIEETLALGGIEILLQGGLHPDLRLDWYEELFRWVKATYPGINLHALSPDEIWHIARLSELPLDAVLDRLVAAGLDSIPGGGAEILDDEVRRRIAPLKSSSDEWLAVMRAAHRRGLRSTATLMFGVGEESRHRATHLLRLRELQDETGGFRLSLDVPARQRGSNWRQYDTPYLRERAHARPRQRAEPPDVVGDDGRRRRPAEAAMTWPVMERTWSRPPAPPSVG